MDDHWSGDGGGGPGHETRNIADDGDGSFLDLARQFPGMSGFGFGVTNIFVHVCLQHRDGAALSVVFEEPMATLTCWFW